ncbi:MAG: hypothetical protein LLG13_11085 [Bacteroidales bacterium]|nr:hypothetical protein [Bacteroidales bacterium]
MKTHETNPRPRTLPPNPLKSWVSTMFPEQEEDIIDILDDLAWALTCATKQNVVIDIVDGELDIIFETPNKNNISKKEIHEVPNKECSFRNNRNKINI